MSGIRVNIRTGTSTRRAQPRAHERKWQYDNQVHREAPEFTVERETVQRTTSYNGLLNLLRAANYAPGWYNYPPRHGLNSHVINLILENSMNDGELQRDGSVQLDIEKHNCRSTDVTQTCGICKENFSLGDELSTLQCDHTFHHSCIEEWGKYKPECPLCRGQILVLER